MPHPTLFQTWIGRLCFLLLASLLLSACKQDTLFKQESFVFGTRVEIISAGHPEVQTREALGAVLREFDRLHRTYHAWQPSELTALNAAFAAGKSAAAEPEMLALIKASQHYAQLGNHSFDPAIGHLIELWGFHSDNFEPRLPEPLALNKILAAQPSVAQISISGNLLRSSNPQVALDFGGIAKGYALDRAVFILHAHGIRNALINIGGNVMALGSKNGQPWQVGIQHPRASGPLATLALYDGEAIGTSGDYQRFFELEGKRYSHLLDPHSGQPATHTQALSILITPRQDAGMLSDAASKPIFLAAAAWREMARRFEIKHVLRVDAAGRIAVTTDMRARLRWADGVSPDAVVE